ncbi:hypothetical protein MATL_G00251170 [Megalops atlanticus]|uniref:Photolyase/cryptochrome alpha/beta domain-containing protein n=1 Tax=Megalops atlanticus TaxID=7932 RepID=A0A9D3T0V3_MEGAT|nr:hypothetical protein MATL_G00251170 [Megalops atlanticus]
MQTAKPLRVGTRGPGHRSYRSHTDTCITTQEAHDGDPVTGRQNLSLLRGQNRFLLQCLEDLDTSLRKLNSRLFVIRGQPTNVFPRMFKAWVANFERPQMNANSLLASPTGLSPYLRFGCLSCCLFYLRLTDLYKKVKKNSLPPRPCMDSCCGIPWDHKPEALTRWAEAKTGFSWIEAIMTQFAGVCGAATQTETTSENWVCWPLCPAPPAMQMRGDFPPQRLGRMSLLHQES